MEGIFLMREIVDEVLQEIAFKVSRKERLSARDALVILKTKDILSLGKIADEFKRTKSGDAVFYSTNQHINYSNICNLRCSFCRFSRDREDHDAYEMSAEKIVEQIQEDTTEIHIVGSLHPEKTFSYYLEMIHAIKQARSKLNIKAFTAVEIAHMAKKSNLSIKDVLSQLKNAGLDALPGGGAEVFSSRVRNILCPGKIPGHDWLSVHKVAHSLGIPTNATILYGHIETPEERIEHLQALRELQDETRGFLSFVPLPFQRWDGAPYGGTTSIEDLRMVALSRLFLDNFPHVKAYWVMLGLETTAMGLCFGADDIDGTVRGERIAHSAGASTPQQLDKDRIIEMISEINRRPVLRDSFYNPLK